MGKTIADKISCYSTSRDYVRLTEKMKSSSVICILTDPDTGEQRLARTRYIAGDTWEDYSLDTSGSNYIRASNSMAFLNGCIKLNVEYIP